MLIASLKQHFPARKSEWISTGMAASWGLDVILHPSMFSRPETAPLFSGLLSMTEWTGLDPAGVWGSVALIAGLVGACALFINGAYSRTPKVRMVASAVRAIIWAEIVLGLIRSHLPNTGVAIYPWMVVIDLLAAYSAGIDAAYAENNKAQEVGRGAAFSRR